MKAYRVTLLIIDHDNLGGEEIRDVIEGSRYPNHCISPDVKLVEERDIGEWSDGHPLNQRDTSEAEYERLFGKVDDK